MTAPRPSPAFRVIWWDWRGHHDLIGRYQLPKDGVYRPLRVKPPKRQTREFQTREGAENFVAELRRRVPRDELLVQIVDAHTTPKAEPNKQLHLADDWPLFLQPDGETFR